MPAAFYLETCDSHEQGQLLEPCSVAGSRALEERLELLCLLCCKGGTDDPQRVQQFDEELKDIKWSRWFNNSWRMG